MTVLVLVFGVRSDRQGTPSAACDDGVMKPLDVIARQALSQEDSPYGAVGVLHSGSDLEAWWIWKDGEEVEPTLSVMDRDDLLYVVRGSLRLELEGRSPPCSAPASWS